MFKNDFSSLLLGFVIGIFFAVVVCFHFIVESFSSQVDDNGLVKIAPQLINKDFMIWTDPETNVEYVYVRSSGVLCPRVNPDGTIKTKE